jgi:recombination protein RecR
MSGEKYPETLIDLIAFFKTLPGIGSRSATRIAFSILKWNGDKQKSLGNLIAKLDSAIVPCPECGNLSEKDELCKFCSDLSRDKSTICVVEDVMQISTIEAGALFKGMYHVLGGRIAPLDGRGAEELNIPRLLERIEQNGVFEVILALGQDVEGQATAIYISELLKDKNIKITRLARGLPAGSDLSYADPATIAVALSGRTTI